MGRYTNPASFTCNSLYIVHEPYKRATLFSIIGLLYNRKQSGLRRFLVDFYTFCTSGNRKEYSITQMFTSYSYFTKVNTLSLNIGLFFTKNLWECEFFLQKTDKIISHQELENTNIGRLSAKVANNRFNRTYVYCA